MGTSVQIYVRKLIYIHIHKNLSYLFTGMYKYNNESIEGKVFVSSAMKSENKGKEKIIIYESYNCEVHKISHLFTDKFIVGLNMNESSESQRDSQNIGKCKVNLSEIIIWKLPYKRLSIFPYYY